jgi:hypothetical protein
MDSGGPDSSRWPPGAQWDSNHGGRSDLPTSSGVPVLHSGSTLVTGGGGGGLTDSDYQEGSYEEEEEVAAGGDRPQETSRRNGEDDDETEINDAGLLRSMLRESEEYYASMAANQADEEKQCWVCFALEEDDPTAVWTHPCRSVARKK